MPDSQQQTSELDFEYNHSTWLALIAEPVDAVLFSRLLGRSIGSIEQGIAGLFPNVVGKLTGHHCTDLCESGLTFHPDGGVISVAKSGQDRASYYFPSENISQPCSVVWIDRDTEAGSHLLVTTLHLTDAERAYRGTPRHTVSGTELHVHAPSTDPQFIGEETASIPLETIWCS